ncbi:MAG: DUF721 domain-containing protein [Alphaproteobacteria bacterium]|nr:DUF721 domain-containing protein [Alphaproteobacteria bacterium]
MPDAPPKRKGMLRLGDALPAVTTPAFKKLGFHEARLVRDWPAIVGESLASQSRPQRLTFPRDKKTDGILRVEASPGFALEMQYMESTILERIAAYFGFRAVSRLQIKQAFDFHMPATAKPKPHAAPVTLPEALHDQLNVTSDDALRKALAALATGVHGRHGG